MATTINTSLYIHEDAMIENLQPATATGHPLTWQQRLSVLSGSEDYLDITDFEISVKNKLVHDTVVDTTNTSVADHLTDNPSFQWEEGDELILTSNALGARVYEFDGGTVTASNFTVRDDTMDANLIRSYFSAGDGISISGGVISATEATTEVVRETGVTLTASTPYTFSHGFSGVPLIMAYDSNGLSLIVDLDVATGTSGDATVTSASTETGVTLVAVG